VEERVGRIGGVVIRSERWLRVWTWHHDEKALAPPITAECGRGLAGSQASAGSSSQDLQEGGYPSLLPHAVNKKGFEGETTRDFRKEIVLGGDVLVSRSDNPCSRGWRPH
jgi:hypothetical protein